VKKRIIELEHEVSGFRNVSQDELIEKINNFNKELEQFNYSKTAK